MSHPRCIAAALLLFSTSAFATTGGPNGFEPLGVDAAGKIHLRESVGGETNEFKLWVFDPAAPTKPTVTPLAPNAPAPAGLTPLAQLPFNELTLAGGEIVRQSLHPREDVLLHKFDLRATLVWRTVRTTVDLIAFKTAEVRLVGGYAAPKGSCAVALVSTLGQPYEGGYELQKPVMLCAAKGALITPARPAQPTRPVRRAR